MMITYIAASSPQHERSETPATPSGCSPSRQRVHSDRLPTDPDTAGRMLQDVRQGWTKVELAEALLVADPHDHKVDATLQDLVDDRRTDIAGVKQIGVAAQAESFGNLLSVIEQILAT